MLLTKPCPDAQYDKKPSHDADSRATLRAGVHRIYLPAPLDAHAAGRNANWAIIASSI